MKELKYQVVTSVKLSNKIHELGVILPSRFYRECTTSEEVQMWDGSDYCPDNVNCFTADELAEKLIYLIENKLIKAEDI